MQISLFDGSQRFKIDKPIRLIELFAGYGSQALALKYLGVTFEHHRIAEWTLKSTQAYKDLHFENDNTDYSKEFSVEYLIDYLFEKGISQNYSEPMTKEQIKRLGEEKIRTAYNNIIATHNLVSVCTAKGKDLGIADTDKFTYVLTYSFPCQDLSSAGKGAGMGKGNGTRSGLLWEVERLLEETKELPQVLLMENVPEVIGANNIKHFAKWIEKLESLGYKNKWQCLNAKDFEIPQNRDRCFMVSILGDYYYDFPQNKLLRLKLKDMLEKEVDEKYYLSDRIIDYFTNHSKECERKGNGFRFEPTDGNCVSKCITTRAGGRMDDNFIKEQPNLKRELCNKLIKNSMVEESDVIRHSYTKNRLNNGIDNMSRVESKDKLCPTLDTRCDCLGVVVKSNNKHLKELCQKIDITETQALDTYNQTTHKDTFQTIRASINSRNEDFVCDDLRIRKLTPKECWRLMGVKDEDYEKVAKNQSNASLYHLAGDSIVVNVLMAIFKEML